MVADDPRRPMPEGPPEKHPLPGGPPKQPAPEMTIPERKKLICQKLGEMCSQPVLQERLLRMAGGDLSRVAKNLTAFQTIIMQDDGSGDPKKFYAQCSLSSLLTCFMESMNMQLPFDSRKLISMIIYDYEAEVDISYKGFVFSLNKHYDNAYVDAKLVFSDDEFTCEETGGKAVFKHVAKNPFKTVDKDFTGIAGAYCYFSYTTKNGEPISRIVRMSRDEILMVKSKARTGYVWKDFPGEMGVKAVIRRGAKIPFAAIDLDIDVEEVGNRHYLLDKPDSQPKLENLMRAQEEVVNEKNDDKGGKPVDEKAGAGDKAVPSGDQGNAPPHASENPMPADPVVEMGETASVVAGDHAEERGNAGGAAPAPIVDAEFEDMPPEGQLTDGNGDPAAAAPSTAPTPSPAPAQAEWDGKTIHTGDGKKVEKDFTDIMGAMIYLKKVIGVRKHRASRQAIYMANQPLVLALLRAGKRDEVTALSTLAEGGE